MYAVIRRYTSKERGLTKDNLKDLQQRIDHDFVPMLHDVPGFHGYYAMNVNDRELVTISICETKAAVTETTRRAADFVKKDPLKDTLGTPEVFEGDLLVVKESIAAR
jgi:hypothetical protein